MFESTPSCNTTGQPMPSGGNQTPSMIDPQASFNVFATVILAGTMIATPFLRVGVGSRYFFGLPTVGALLIQGLIIGNAQTNLDRGLLQLLLYAWVSWVPVRLIWASIRGPFSPRHSQYNGWPLLCALSRIRNENSVKLILEPGILMILSLPWARQAPIFSGLLFFVGLCLFGAHVLASHLVTQRARSLFDSELEQRQAMSHFRRMRGGMS